MNRKRPRTTASLNMVRNADFRLGRELPRAWTWGASGPTAEWRREAGIGGIALSAEGIATAAWTQTVDCKPGEFYRVEGVVAGDVSARPGRGGAAVSVELLPARRATSARHSTPPIRGCFGRTVIRGYFQAPQGVRRVRLSVGLFEAGGELVIESVRFLHILEPDAVGHVLAIPGPSWTQTAPIVVESVRLVGREAGQRSLTRILERALGAHAVCTDETPMDRRRTADALLFLDDELPESMATVPALLELARDRIVVVSLAAFARLARAPRLVRIIAQPDDPMHASAAYSNFATTGFALHDIFPFAATRPEGSFIQRQFRPSAAFTSLCRRHGFRTLLTSVCEKDSTSDKPIALFRTTDRGALFVMDLECMEADSSTLGEAVPAVHLLLSMLGRADNGLGQWTVPERTESHFRRLIRECGARFEEFVVHDEDVPVEQVRQQLVTIGREDQSFGLPLRPKPVILVRSGLHAGDVESIYGAWTWFKELIRPSPHSCPYANALASRFRLAWVPCVAGWADGDGWQALPASSGVRTELELTDGELHTVVDLAAVPVQSVRLVAARRNAQAEHCATWLGRLFEAFGAAAAFTFSAPEGDDLADRSRVDWRMLRLRPQCSVNAVGFTEPFHRQALSHGAQLLRLEFPGRSGDFVSHSIARTGLVATLLEQVIGLQYGLIAVNRGRAPVQLDGFAPVAPGDTLLVERETLARASANAG